MEPEHPKYEAEVLATNPSIGYCKHLPKTRQKNYSLSQLSRWHNGQPNTVPSTAGSDQTTSGVYVKACYFPLFILKNYKLRAYLILTQLR
jgi:hypothetical protein